MKKCEWCGKEIIENKRFCNTSCSAYWRNATLGPNRISESTKRANAERLKNCWKSKKFRENNHKRMTQNNPVHRAGVIEKAHKTRLQNGPLPNNFKYGNGCISLYEEKVFTFLRGHGFYYNYAINTKIARDTFLEKKFAYSYKPDFVNLKKKVIIEIDGPNHKMAKIKEIDKKKDECLEFLGFSIFRFTHAQIDEFELFKKEVELICQQNF
jgi:very-short-patch-repair endonuclease